MERETESVTDADQDMAVLPEWKAFARATCCGLEEVMKSRSSLIRVVARHSR